MSFSINNKHRNHNRGFTIMIALIIGTVILVLSVTLYTFMSHQYTGMHTIVNGEIAHFLAETGINTCLGTLRTSISENLGPGGKSSEKLKDIILNSKSLENTCINKLLGEVWNDDLKKFSAEVDKTASIEVNVYLRKFKPMETDTDLWADPKSAKGSLVVEAIGEYRGSRRKIMINRDVSVVNMVPGVMGKFSLYLNDADKKSENDFNIIKNDYKGMITDGPKPIIVYNHATPEYSVEPANIADIEKEEKDPEIWKKRGWIWLKGDKIRLNLCSGAGDLGEIFHFYDVSKPNSFSPVKFSTVASKMPETFFQSHRTPWDKSSDAVKMASYRFWHSFILDAFHDRSSRMESEAMYEGNILSYYEKHHYGSKSSILHLFGDARKGYQSRTRVIGPVRSAFVRFANLEVKPEEDDVKAIFEANNPKPIYLLQSLPFDNYSNSINICEFTGRVVGGPIINIGMLFKDHNEYSSFMSGVVEQPYVDSYNSMQEVYDKADNRFFPPQKKLLGEDLEGDSVISRDEHIFYKGCPEIEDSIKLIRRRIQNTIETPADFWKKYLNEDGELELNSVVCITNSRNEEFIVPPPGRPQPLRVKGGGIVLLEKGSIALRGVSLMNTSEILTIASAGDGKIRFESTQPNHVNIVAPHCEVDYGSRFELFGSLCAKSIYADHRFQGGVIRYRQASDPTRDTYDKFYKIFVAPKDSYWITN